MRERDFKPSDHERELVIMTGTIYADSSGSRKGLMEINQSRLLLPDQAKENAFIATAKAISGCKRVS